MIEGFDCGEHVAGGAFGSVHRGPAFIVVRKREGGVQGRESDPPPAPVGVFQDGPRCSPARLSAVIAEHLSLV